MAVVYLSLGSNTGDRVGYIQQAVKMLAENDKTTLIRCSAFYETEPCENKNQPDFINAVAEMKTKLSPDELLNVCNDIEKKLGRVRTEERYTPRTIDIDIILYDDLVVNSGRLTIPHAKMHERAFVLVPLLELIPNHIHPVFKKSLSKIYEELENPEDVNLYGTKDEQ